MSEVQFLNLLQFVSVAEAGSDFRPVTGGAGPLTSLAAYEVNPKAQVPIRRVIARVGAVCFKRFSYGNGFV